ncbi:IclR family transcriptional regulator [Kribbella sp. NPDC054772]
MRSLERAIDVLEVLEDAPRGLRLSELARRANLHVATTLRILTTLEARGRVEHDGTHYRAGVRLLFGAHAYLTTSPLVLAARSVLQDLASDTGLTSSVFVRAGAHRAVIARVEGSNPLRYELPVGERLPLHLGASKVLVAQLPDDELEPLIAEVTPFTTAGGREVTAAMLRRELRDIATSGFAVSRDERVLGGRSVSAPVLGQDGAAIAAIQVAGNEETFPSRRLKSLTSTVRNAADSLSRRI